MKKLRTKKFFCAHCDEHVKSTKDLKGKAHSCGSALVEAVHIPKEINKMLKSLKEVK